MKITISGTGCALADFLYNGISFESPGFKKYLSKKTGDGGLSPGKLVFTEELEKFAGRPYPEIFHEIAGSRAPDGMNVGGPSVVSLIHASQLLDNKDFEVKFFGISGTDEIADRMLDILWQTPLDLNNYRKASRRVTPFTDVLSDPAHDHGHGERTFVNNIGAAWDFFPENLPEDFFESQIVCFGGTGLVPNIHDHLTGLLRKAKAKNCITVVNTVFDFRNEKKNPGKPWPLVDDIKDFGLIDVLIMDCTEALMISGKTGIEEASSFFAQTGVGSFIITNGAQELVAWSAGGLFEKSGMVSLPVSKIVTAELRSNPQLKGDTTGCGDNFAGGIIASLAWQLKECERGQFHLLNALSWGIASGGFCCFTIGGTYIEKGTGEKRARVKKIQEDYLNQIAG
ncbi:MAG: carbohydrate kinase family protein [Bacteroidales bacterium]|jgi:sugar/nucleoside kinase (ribokinase family)